MSSLFFFNDTATTEIYTLSLHDALPIWLLVTHAQRCLGSALGNAVAHPAYYVRRIMLAQGRPNVPSRLGIGTTDRKSTRLNSSHANISYAVFCLKKKKLVSYMPATRASQ